MVECLDRQSIVRGVGESSVIDERWKELSHETWVALARAWMAELRGSAQDAEESTGAKVVLMNFTAAPEHQWLFIRLAVAEAQSDEELGAIAAGPVEHLLGWHGPEFVSEVEAQAAADPKFARMLGGVVRYLMTDDVWARVQKLIVRQRNSAGVVNVPT